ncbi:OLC1v1017537C1 [Oldenlandia corymbosa var. corymbosa]|uniref:OLC1v1017537C1 n=1 Tax=Oldenlandia corymbosa var. corymbosa TaxID=529605 RepID=A0AAV1E9S0_OLDCO|nr:OLC1v1017537C1 [Oldenlandia corymbosa var. corymbosa]
MDDESSSSSSSNSGSRNMHFNGVWQFIREALGVILKWLGFFNVTKSKSCCCQNEDRNDGQHPSSSCPADPAQDPTPAPTNDDPPPPPPPSSLDVPVQDPTPADDPPPSAEDLGRSARRRPARPGISTGSGPQTNVVPSTTLP